MTRLKIGIHLESLGLPLRKALTEAAKLGVPGVQVDAVGDLAPRNLSQSGRRDFRNLLRSNNLELTAVGCPLRRGLDETENQQPRIEHVCEVLTLAYDLGPRRVLVQAGAVPEDPDSTAGRALTESMLAVGKQGDRTGSILAIETGLESGETLATWLKRFSCASLAVNLDPANLLLHGFDPLASARALRGLVVHVNARDGRRASTSRSAQEVPLGHGDIDWFGLFAGLEEIEYRGWIVVKRESGDQKAADLAAGVGFLRRFIA